MMRSARNFLEFATSFAEFSWKVRHLEQIDARAVHDLGSAPSSSGIHLTRVYCAGRQSLKRPLVRDLELSTITATRMRMKDQYQAHRLFNKICAVRRRSPLSR